MNRSRLAGALLLGCLLALAVLRMVWIGGHLSSLRPVEAGQGAIDFRLPLLGGGEFRLAEGQGVTLVDFWATWCGPCREELPHVEALYRRYKDRGVRMVAVDAEAIGAKPAAERLAGQLQLTLPIALAGDEVAGAYKVDNLPTLMVIDKQGHVGRVLLGLHDESEIAALIEDALRQAP